ncbi:LysR family transcriptional regulator [Vibrio sonorensis]|uniref:LysR family transcriptional regulator n=1 Tax=Vibrio sonorensis TaxID=1004316 RepID=UPI0008D98812|nr:LysR family transcriptional regulator [Vibrio sonorensis]
MITLDQINAFRAVFDKGSYSAAGRSIGKDRTTVRELVLALEDEVGKPLFEIQGKKAVPTQVAEYLFPRANHLVKQADDFQHIASTAYRMSLMEVKICYDVQIPSEFLALLDAEIAKEYPSLLVHWLHRNRNDALQLLENDEAHLALLPILSGLLPDQRVGIINIGACQLAAYAHPDSQLAKLETVTIRDLARYPQWVNEDVILTDKQVVKVSPMLQMVSNNDLAVRLLGHRGWTVLNLLDGNHYEKLGMVKRLNLEEKAKSYHNGVSLFYNFSYETDSTMKNIIKIVKKCSNLYLG